MLDSEIRLMTEVVLFAGWLDACSGIGGLHISPYWLAAQ